ncbi:Ureidoglycolate lyase [Anaerohalosphaera lusitana]|uniref:Ureidoglycolate lyase n=1 Tax=Anaerohalosphaera lusitana TaxID=1936003 RepID=A0A1U9NM26_9BACT|nr:fumarylacetoacetate hydrolase family protein [Anaerohalosphaera lusitana]AQT68546.1 Ureidoglycolate lyase [Anaerohalosphaera lusitana]
MKLVSFRQDGSESYGVLNERGVVDVPKMLTGPQPPETLLAMLERPDAVSRLGDIAQQASEVIPLSDVELLAPITRPGKLLALAGNYVKHIVEAGKKLGLSESPRKTTVPRPFLMPPNVLTATNTTIPLPCYSETVDYEIELTVVMGRTAKCVSPEEALEYVAGYTIGNDISARTVTFKEDRSERPWDEFFDWLNGKWSDAFFPMGPCLVTADEIGDPQKLDLELKVNGEVRQKANTKDMIFTVADTVSFLSHIMTLEPGDCIATGTPEGVGMASGVFLQPGDEIECSIEKIGTLTNLVGQRPDHKFKPCQQL